MIESKNPTDTALEAFVMELHGEIQTIQLNDSIDWIESLLFAGQRLESGNETAPDIDCYFTKLL